jgi:hypothetical protein
MDFAAQTPTSGGTPWWITLVVTAVPACASIAAAVIAARSARKAKLREAETERIRELENRISERKYETYRPMLQLVGDAFNVAKASQMTANPQMNVDKFSDFTTWITVYGSDEALQAFHNFTLAAGYNPPPIVTLRLVADFILAARRDIGYPDTSVTAMQLVAMKMKDLYDEDESRLAMTLPFDEVCRRAGWIPPWSRSVASAALGKAGPAVTGSSSS